MSSIALSPTSLPVSDSEVQEIDNHHEALDLINFIISILSKELKSAKILNLISSKFSNKTKKVCQSHYVQTIGLNIDKIKKENLEYQNEKENLLEKINELTKDKEIYKNQSEEYKNALNRYNDQASQMHLNHNKAVNDKELCINTLSAENQKLKKELKNLQMKNLEKNLSLTNQSVLEKAKKKKRKRQKENNPNDIPEVVSTKQKVTKIDDDTKLKNKPTTSAVQNTNHTNQNYDFSSNIPKSNTNAINVPQLKPKNNKSNTNKPKTILIDHSEIFHDEHLLIPSMRRLIPKLKRNTTKLIVSKDYKHGILYDFEVLAPLNHRLNSNRPSKNEIDKIYKSGYSRKQDVSPISSNVSSDTNIDEPENIKSTINLSKYKSMKKKGTTMKYNTQVFKHCIENLQLSKTKNISVYDLTTPENSQRGTGMDQDRMQEKLNYAAKY